MTQRPIIAVLCGSTSQREDFDRLNELLTLEGKIVLAPGVWRFHGRSVFGPMESHTKCGLDQLHLAKIDMADEVHIIPKADGSLGSSTRAEYLHAIESEKMTVIHTTPSITFNAGSGRASRPKEVRHG